MITDKVALVTGAGQGIGRAVAIELARQGAGAIAVVDRDEVGARETAELVRAAGAETDVLVCDLRDRDQIEATVAAAAARHGGLDVLVNNAGIIETSLTDPKRCTVDELPEDVWEAVYEVNLRATWLATRFAARHLRASRRGPSIVNAASVSGLTGLPGAPGYGVTKAAVIQLTKLTAVDLAPHVRCNCLCPGIIETPMACAYIDGASDSAARERSMTSQQLIERLGTPEEIAGLACFLASDAAAFITGANVVADGASSPGAGTADHVHRLARDG